jgi:hypothetical protein
MFLRHKIVMASLAFGLAACTTAERSEANREAREAGRELEQATDGAARKTGRAAYEIADETKEAAKKAGKAVGKAAREMREGWKEAARDDRADGK